MPSFHQHEKVKYTVRNGFIDSLGDEPEATGRQPRSQSWDASSGSSRTSTEQGGSSSQTGSSLSGSSRRLGNQRPGASLSQGHHVLFESSSSDKSKASSAVRDPQPSAAETRSLRRRSIGCRPAAFGGGALDAASGEQPRAYDELLADLKSRGSLLHDEGRCRPCGWFAAGNCVRGVECVFCHEEHKKARGRPSKNIRNQCCNIAELLKSMFPGDDPARAKLAGMIAAESRYLFQVFEGRNIAMVQATRAEVAHLVTPELDELLKAIRWDSDASYSKQSNDLSSASKLSL
ncbi:unnamed protein product [Polarella glacialis]|uniref:C3H1-type domain-containing protein n=1 Tax=Polarella glacialis TaxID=89957 RepID=A0A813DJ41_POLGL|nr:unnamed protein product [Polarella glacialis]